MLLYHGSSIEVKNPKIIQSKRSLDFGHGFYLTSDIEQAKKWGIRKAKIFGLNKGIVSIYDFNDKNDLNVLRFDSATNEWLDFVVKNRSEKDDCMCDYDLIIGPVANDQTMQTINLYIRGYIDKDSTIKMLLSQNLRDQYVFKTSKALSTLEFKESRAYE